MKHSRIGASSCARWWNCPGSVALLATLPERRQSSKYAIEGTVAHWVGEQCLLKEHDPFDYIGEIIEEQDLEVKVTSGMAEAVQLYLDTIDADLAEHGLDRKALRVEAKFALTDVDPDAFGTNDCLLEVPFKKLYVYDYKHGAGVPVNVLGNKQLLFYALGAAMTSDFSEVELVIVQPRANHEDGCVRRWVITAEMLEEFKQELIKRIAETKKPKAIVKAGKWCKFCDAGAICPALKKNAEEVLVSDFAGVPVAIDQVPMVQILKAYEKKSMVLDWFSKIDAYLLDQLEHGQKVDGYKLVKKRSNRKWINEDDVVRVFGKPLQDELYVKPKIKSPAQLEKLVGKKDVAPFIFKPEAGVTVAHVSDKRPEVITGNIQDDFNEI